jgi:DNA polymerase-4
MRTADPAKLRAAVGSLADWLTRLAHGLDDRRVVSERTPKSSGSENTFATDLTDLAEMRHEVAEMARDAAAWLIRREMFARTVTLKLRYSDFTTITRSHTDMPTQNGDLIERRAVGLLDRTEAASRAVRLLGVSVHNFMDAARVSALPDGWLPFEDDV